MGSTGVLHASGTLEVAGGFAGGPADQTIVRWAALFISSPFTAQSLLWGTGM